MKIGILTYHRSHNYGALLQAVALRVSLQLQGHEVYYIDYWPKYHQDMYSVFDTTLFRRLPLKNKFAYLFSTLRERNGRKKRIEAIKPFITEYIEPYCKPYNGKEEYDVVIYGSDQIWRKQRGVGYKLNPVYFGQNLIKSKKKVAYAASMGNIDLNAKDYDCIRDWLSDFSLLGVRENNIFNILKELHLENVYLNLDPTLLLNVDQWTDVIRPKRLVKEKYAVLYQIKKAFDEKRVRDFCKHKGLRLIVIPSGYSFKERNSEFVFAGPADFISLFMYADFCFVASFHGLVFSINFGRQFLASFATAANRAETVVSNLGLCNRLVSPFDSFPQDIPEIDYTEVTAKLFTLRNKNSHFLDAITEDV